jgi:hypothetical protein
LSLISLLNNANIDTSSTVGMFMIPTEMKKQVAYLQTLSFICEKEKMVIALPQLIEIK